MQFHRAEEANKVEAVVRDERKFVLRDALSQFPIRPAAQAEMVNVDCFETSAMGDSNEGLMQAFRR
jgi:hypothetical protein